MGAQERLKVDFLSSEEALDLFLRTVGKDTLTLHPDMRNLAETIVDECKGLPLAVITVARAMATRKSPEEWRHAIRLLRNHPSLFPGMRGKVFDILMFSYHSLNNETLRRCFRYCCIFPEDYEIHKYDLIQLWIAEKFIEASNYYEARNHGEYIIGSLKLACLLESGESENYVRMHDIVRDMAMSLSWTSYDNILVQGHDGVIGVRDSAEDQFATARRMSFFGLHSDNVDLRQFSRDFKTLLVRNSQLDQLPKKWFQNMSFDNYLVVLDLSHNSCLTELPVEIRFMIFLRHLNVSWTNIRELPVEVKELTDLKTLMMDGTSKLEKIPAQVISCLYSLKVFSRILYPEELVACLPLDRLISLEELECLHLDYLGATLGTPEAIHYIFNSPKLQKCINWITIMDCSDLPSLYINDSCLRKMEHLEKLQVRACHSLEELNIIQEQKKPEGILPGGISNYSTLTGQEFFQNLSHVEFWDCPIKEMTWLIHAPRVQTLKISNCHSIVEVIGDNSGPAGTGQRQNIFSYLKDLILEDLPMLRTIYKQALSFPFLARIKVAGCPNLRKLPLDSNSANNSLKEICGAESWWDQLQWKNGATKHIFSSKFVKCQ
ncbi:hypothetical protein Tsubulata_041987 [Turnera subulata]|uniref:NB-ARC domain-containing protein n=1 Tax=Turnera subulata TaxID=218843 RepID=A0A9Q0JMZ8_9ROSI|nr:hypothetical protein Tsubulata_041987 [Turnera subulata]